jgi:uncharacterized protein (DUF305 family)
VSDAAPGSKPGSRVGRRIDVVSTVLLAVATLATAWAGYQSSRWHSEQAKLQTKATASRIEATRSQDVANREAQVDVALFVQWVDAHFQGDVQLAEFYRARFTDRLAPAFDAWIATRPFANPKAPSSPFVMAQYGVAANEDAASQETAADTAAAQAAEDIHRADNYVLAVVLFAACLFFAGISTRMRTVNGQSVILALGCVLFVATVVWVATFPVTVTI